MKINLGCGKWPLKGYVNIDNIKGDGVDIVADIMELPFDDESVEEIIGIDVLEHIQDTLGLMQELYRVSKPNAICKFKVPYGASDDAWENPTHVRPYFVGSFMPFSQPYWWRDCNNYTADWQAKEIRLFVNGKFESDDWLRDIMLYRNIVLSMEIELVCIKPARKTKKELQENPKINVVPMKTMLINIQTDITEIKNK